MGGPPYGCFDGRRNSWQRISDQAGEDDQLAFDEFFRILPLYLRDLNALGMEHLTARHAEGTRHFYATRSDAV